MVGGFSKHHCALQHRAGECATDGLHMEPCQRLTQVSTGHPARDSQRTEISAQMKHSETEISIHIYISRVHACM